MRIQGQDSIFYIKHEGVWCPIACEIASPLSEETEMISTTTRDNNGWNTSLPTNQSYSISISALLSLDKDGFLSYNAIRQKKRNRELIEWKRVTLEGYNIDEGKGYITSISDSNTVGEDISFDLTIQGFGEPTEYDERVFVLGKTEDNILYSTDNENLIKT